MSDLRGKQLFGLAVLLMVVGALRIAATYTVFSQTVDEPAHVATGMEWLDRGRYAYEPQHPPLARVATALGPYLDGVRSFGDKSMWAEGNRILEARGTYARNLALARLGILPFFLLACLVVWSWTRRLFGDGAALAAVALYSFLPPVLAHAGLATTDMAIAATLPAAILAFMLWLEQPTRGRSVVLGIAMAAAILSKFSAVVFLPAAVGGILACKFLVERRAAGPSGERRRSTLLPGGALRGLLLAAAVLSFVIWAGYRFSITWPTELGGHVPVPAIELAKGIFQVAKHDEAGHPAYLLGQKSVTGWWYFFPVTLAVKTPLPFLVFTGIGLVLTVAAVRARLDWRLLGPVAVAAGVLAVSMTSNINNGVRHILPIYAPLAVIAGFGAAGAWSAARQRAWSRPAIAALSVWLAVSSARAHPDYLAYFNELAGGHPERIVVNTDLCWGQDYFRLVDTVRARGLDSIWVAYHGSLDVDRHRLPGMHPLAQNQRVTGWIAASARELKGVRREGYEWIDAYRPVTRVGRSMWLYYIPPGAGASTSGSTVPAAVLPDTGE